MTGFESVDESIDLVVAAWQRVETRSNEVLEIVLDVVPNAANKIAVAFAADDAVVPEGFECVDTDAHGEVVADVDPDVVRARTVAGAT